MHRYSVDIFHNNTVFHILVLQGYWVLTESKKKKKKKKKTTLKALLGGMIIVALYSCLYMFRTIIYIEPMRNHDC